MGGGGSPSLSPLFGAISQARSGIGGMRFSDARRWQRKIHVWYHRATGMGWRGDPEGERLRGDHFIIFGTMFSFYLFTMALRQGLRVTYYVTSREVRPRDAASVLAVARQEEGYVQASTAVVVASQQEGGGFVSSPPPGDKNTRWLWLRVRRQHISPRARSDRGVWYVPFSPSSSLRCFPCMCSRA